MSGKNEEKARNALIQIGKSADNGFDLLTGAFSLASLNRPDISLEGYEDHIAQIEYSAASFNGENPLNPSNAACHLRKIMAVKYLYTGDISTYEDLRNADLLWVIDRRRGLPVALGILYIHVGRQLGWQLEGLSFPGHFLVRLDINGNRVIIDPFAGGRTLIAHDLREMIKAIPGINRELQAGDYSAISDREILLRLQNNIKFRYMQMRNGTAALKTVESMILIAPKVPNLWWDLAMLNAQLGKLCAACNALEKFMDMDASKKNQLRAKALLKKIQTSIN